MTTTDFSSLLAAEAGTALPSLTLPVGDYPAIIKAGPEYGDNNQKHTPYARFQLILTGWPDSVPEEERGQKDRDGNFVPEDLSARTFRYDLYLSQGNLFNVDKTLRTCGIDLHGRTRGECIPELVGQQITATVEQYVGKSGIGNRIGNIWGPEAVAE